MKGSLTFGATDPEVGNYDAHRMHLRVRLTIRIDDVDAFIADEQHLATVMVQSAATPSAVTFRLTRARFSSSSHPNPPPG